MERILIIGGNGSGKTTFSRALAEVLHLPLIHLDTLYWRDNWTPAPDEEFDALLLEELRKPRWIIDGNISRTLPMRLPYCDTVIYFDFSRLACLRGVLTRSIRYRGQSRSDMGGYCPESVNWSFLRLVWHFNDRLRDRYYSLLGEASHAHVIILKNRRQARAFLRSLNPR